MVTFTNEMTAKGADQPFMTVTGAELERSGDPRLVDDGTFFETPPLAGPLPED